jgi:hypothetical protein
MAVRPGHRVKEKSFLENLEKRQFNDSKIKKDSTEEEKGSSLKEEDPKINTDGEEEQAPLIIKKPNTASSQQTSHFDKSVEPDLEEIKTDH